MALFDRLTDFDGKLFRNIVSLRVSANLFDDLVDDEPARGAAMAADSRMRQGAPGVIARGFDYSQAIGYPFASDTTVASRYGDGSLRVWYGALDEVTSLAETSWHQLRQVQAIEGVTDPVTRYRAMYQVRARGLFLELRGKQDEHPELLQEDYRPTQAIARHASGQGLPGMLYPSARWRGKGCLAAFRAEPLSDARVLYYLTFHIDPGAHTVAIERNPGVLERTFHVTDLHTAPR